jgi:hypothetical protein
MREYTKAMDACQAATEADGPERKNAREIEGQMRRCMEEMGKEREGETEQQTLQRAMKDPEVAVSRLQFFLLPFHVADGFPSASLYPCSRSCKIPSCETSSSKPRAILEPSKVRTLSIPVHFIPLTCVPFRTT